MKRQAAQHQPKQSVGTLQKKKKKDISIYLFFQLSRRCHRRTKLWFKSLSAESQHKKCRCLHITALIHKKTPRNSDRSGWSPAAPVKHQTSHQCVNDFLPFRRKKSGGAPDVWHFILTPAYLPCRVDIFSVFMLFPLCRLSPSLNRFVLLPLPLSLSPPSEPSLPPHRSYP